MINCPRLFQSSVLLLLLLLASPSCGQDRHSDIARIAAMAEIPGVQVAHVKGGTTALYSYGVKHVTSQEPVHDQTVFQAASLTKVVAAYTFFRLLDRGLISLDTPLYSYYPYNRLQQNPNRNKITARMVLTHRTGLLNWEGDVPSEAWRATPLTSQFTPGTDYMYSGEGFYFLQEVMEQVTGKSFRTLVEEEVFRPFGMDNSAILWQDGLDTAAAYGHLENGNARQMGKYKKSNAAYTLYTTAADYARFIRKFLFEGFGLKESTWQLAMERAGEAKKGKEVSPEDAYVPCTLGMRMQINEVGTAYWHTGSNPGFRCYFLAYPKDQEILVSFTNSDRGFATMPAILALFLNTKQTFWAYAWRNGELD